MFPAAEYSARRMLAPKSEHLRNSDLHRPPCFDISWSEVIIWIEIPAVRTRWLTSDPDGTAHPRHAGDPPPLMMYQGHAHLEVRTDRFRVADVLGRTVVIHSNPDDFHTQPAGNAGTKIACDVIGRR